MLCTLAANPKFQDLIIYAVCIINKSIIPLLFAVATVVFIWGIVMYVIYDGGEKKERGHRFMIYGLIGLTVMFSVWGLVRILGSTFGVLNVIPQLPQ